MTDHTNKHPAGTKCHGSSNPKTKPLCVITPAMIDAGVYALREKMIGESLERIVQDVFLAMWVEEHSNELGE